MQQQIIYKVARTPADFQQARMLFAEYVEGLGVDLSFQNFADELEILHVQYNHPDGALLITVADDIPVGCAGVRKFDTQIAELKRMYVKKEYRGYRIGVELLDRSLHIAQELGYKKIRLDTLENMIKAQELYRSFGFEIISPYRFNPINGTVYMEKLL